MYRKDSPATIQSMFNSIAERYDLTNSVLSFSLHRYWNNALVHHVQKSGKNGKIVMDLCSGTGDIAFNYLKKASTPCEVYLIDFSSEMLAQAKEKGKLIPSSHQLHYIEADVQELPLADGCVDCATMAYGIRNVQDPARCMREVSRTLREGGCFGILELTRPRSSLLRWGHRFYLRTLLPFLGKWLTENESAYQYLCQSIETFSSPEKLEELLKNNGFVKTEIHPLAGGVATIILGYK